MSGGLERGARVAERTERCAKEPRTVHRSVLQQGVSRRIEPGMRILDGPADPMAERRFDRVETARRSHDPDGPIGRRVFRRKHCDRRRDGLDLGIPGRERKPAHERERQIVARPKSGEWGRRRVVDALDLDLRHLRSRIQQGVPMPAQPWRYVVHPRAGDPLHRKRNVCPTPSRRALSTIAAPSAISESDRPRCQKRIVSSSRSRPGFTPATI